ncbi:response regulator [Methylomonas sp. BW4-1]|uniref:response regulator n=1 Tax=unclassified Methylomonas TaxID=2608980 RepID=UPI00051B0F50|nr:MULTISPECIES: response regulator [unclassified Methylomonas]NOV30292.1 response regulator [Methylomonas sp. ZR1]PKD37871.1 response regulator receiver protein [Methylomonas sp. Kb3]QBC28377.1 response regulator [Methylomonas sp. LW13]QSB00049.1 response regulator [Methylomonas sp. EFPC1]
MVNNILVIDDDPAVRGAFKLILEEEGYRVREAENGLQGIAMVEADRPDLIFLDLRMPGIDGVETLRRLKALDTSLNVYIVTAFAAEFMDQLKDAHEEGLQFELASKPLSASQIRNIAQVVHIAKVHEERRANHHKLVLTLYVVSLNPETRRLVEQISAVLAGIYEPGHWVFDVVEVLGMPEKALEKEIFATPMLVRDLPEPVLKLLGDLSRMSSVMAAITTQNVGTGVQTVIV